VLCRSGNTCDITCEDTACYKIELFCYAGAVCNVYCDENTDTNYCPELQYSYWTTEASRRMLVGWSDSKSQPKHLNDARLDRLFEERKKTLEGVKQEVGSRVDLSDPQNTKPQAASKIVSQEPQKTSKKQRGDMVLPVAQVSKTDIKPQKKSESRCTERRCSW